MKIGRYEVIRKLATGGMAEVFLAKVAGPLGFEKTLVLKRILPHLVDEPSFVEMFLAEAKLVAQLNHPHIVQIFDFGEADGAYFLAMEYIDGPNLRTLLKCARGLNLQLPPTLCAKMVAAACEGLAYAHDFRDPATQQPLNLIHRDISPDNILLSRQGAVKVADFGIAKVAGHGPQTKEGILKGKLPYMSPEHLRSQQIDRRADVYALGLVLYELLTHRKPFDVTMEAGILRAILYEPFIPAAERRPELPELIQQILDRALAKERDERYPDCLSFQADLERFIISQGEAPSSLRISHLISQLEVESEKAASRSPLVVPSSPAPTSMEAPSTLSLPHVNATEAPKSPTRPRNALRTVRQDKTVVARRQEHAPASLLESTVALDEATLFEEKMRSQGGRHVTISLLAILLFVSGGGYLLWRGGSPSTPKFPDKPLSIHVASGFDAGLPEEGRPLLAAVSDSLSGSPELPPIQPAAYMAEADAGSLEPIPSPSLDDGPAPLPIPTSAAPRPKTLRPSSQRPNKNTPAKTLIDFRVLPYATVFLDDKEVGTTPFAAIEASPGRHMVRLINQESSKTETLTITLEPGELRVVKHNFNKN